MTTVIKLGGSVITEKDQPETVDREALDRATAAVSKTNGPLVLVHGGGSFGHHYAAEYGVSTTVGTEDTSEIRSIHSAMKRLNTEVIDSLVAANVPAVPVHPFSAGDRDTDGRLRLDTGPVSTMIDAGFVPVLHGDVVADASKGATIVSGDELVVSLATALAAPRVGVCSSVPGVFDEDDRILDRIESLDDVASAVGESDTTDVSGGMAGKVRELLVLDAPAYIFDIEGLESFVGGGTPGTRVG